MPVLSDTQDDIRALALIDKRHRSLADVSDRWFDRSGFTWFSERAVDDTPLVAVALDYPQTCPIDKTANMMIKYWLANLNRRGDLLAAYVENIKAINAHMATVGAEKVWGLVPKTSDWMTGFLDRVAAAGACKKTDGAGIPIGDDLDPNDDYRNFYFYVGERQAVTDEMEAR
jgi:hypothetical protein